MKRSLFYLFIIVTISLQSCLSIIANKLELNSETPKLEKIEVKGKEVYFLGMAHLAKKEFYDNTKTIIKELQPKGFIFYVESVSDFEKPTIQLDSFSAKKLRKLTSLDLSIKYSQSQNIYLQKIKNKYSLIDQPNYTFFEIKNYKRVDYLYTDLINFYESKYGNIVLDTCDINTALGEIYNCQTLQNAARKNFSKEIILDRRNKLIVDSLLNSADKKIVIIYGKNHLKGIKQNLIK